MCVSRDYMQTNMVMCMELVDRVKPMCTATSKMSPRSSLWIPHVPSDQCTDVDQEECRCVCVWGGGALVVSGSSIHCLVAEVSS